MGYSSDIPNHLMQPGMKEELILYLNNLPIPGFIRKNILFEYQDLTGEKTTYDDVRRVYDED